MTYEKIKVTGGTVFRGDCLDVMKALPDNSIDGVVTDPPYGLSKEPNIVEVLTHWLAGDVYEHNGSGFMGKSWDSFIPGPEYWKELYRVMKPGAFALIFSGTRTWDLMGISLRLGGFSIKDTISWLYSSGFPKSSNISAKIDQKFGLEREVIGQREDILKKQAADIKRGRRKILDSYEAGAPERNSGFTTISADITAPASEDAKDWSGYGTALKPAWEPIIIAQKPLEGTYVNNILKHGVGALNIDACRVHGGPSKGGSISGSTALGQGSGWNKHENRTIEIDRSMSQGRFPANLVLQHSPNCVKLGSKKIKGSGTSKTFHDGYKGDSTTGFVRGISHPGNQHADPDGTETIEEYQCVSDCPVHLLNEQAGIRPGCKSPSKAKPSSKFRPEQGNYMPQDPIYGDTGYASRFFLNLEGEEPSIDSESWECSEDCPIHLLDEQSGNVSYGKKEGGYSYSEKEYQVEGFVKSCKPKSPSNYGDEGGASRFFLNIEGEEPPTRFFYCGKASRKERGEGNTHPTVKPKNLLLYLLKLITPPKPGIILDPFAGSGTTLVACKELGIPFIGIELESDYVEIAKKRLDDK
jgi:site-specific DNA-methyltransferase (adenine-specific)